jgi:WD40 repeat protein
MACSYGAVYLFDVGESCDLASHPFESQQLMEKGLMLFAVSTSYVQSPEDSSVIFAGMQDEIAMVWIVERAKSSVKILQKLKLRGFASKVTEISIDSVHGRYVACSGSINSLSFIIYHSRTKNNGRFPSSYRMGQWKRTS